VRDVGDRANAPIFIGRNLRKYSTRVEHRSFITSRLSFSQLAHCFPCVMKHNLGRRKPPPSAGTVAPRLRSSLRMACWIFSDYFVKNATTHALPWKSAFALVPHHPSLSPLVTRVHLFRPPPRCRARLFFSPAA